MTLALRLDDTDVPPYEQLRRQVADHVAAGRLPAGTRLPPVRQLAGDLGIAPGTVARAYRELEAAGVVVTRRGAGTTVAPRPPVPDVEGRLRDAVTAALAGGVDPARVRDVVEEAVRAAG